MTSEPRPRAVVDAESEPFWEAAATHRLRLPHGVRSGRPHFFPRSFEPGTGDEVVWRDLPATGSVYSMTVVHRPPSAFAGDAPYVVALVELDAGPRVLARLATAVTAVDRNVTIGQRVELVLPGGGEAPLARLVADPEEER